MSSSDTGSIQDGHHLSPFLKATVDLWRRTIVPTRKPCEMFINPQDGKFIIHKFVFLVKEKKEIIINLLSRTAYLNMRVITGEFFFRSNYENRSLNLKEAI